jgi:3-hydroxymyristoyl/3-hydroxydecanoyl-(acyl carrier protein) dehydratase
MRYVLIDRITSLVPGHSLTGIKNVTASEDLVTRYANGVSALPSAMTLEAMAQAAGVLVAATISFRAQPVLAKVQPFAAFGQARPGDRIDLRAELEDLRDQGCRARATARIGSHLLAEATIYLALVPFEDGESARHDDRIRRYMADMFPEWFAVSGGVEAIL